MFVRGHAFMLQRLPILLRNGDRDGRRNLTPDLGSLKTENRRILYARGVSP
jgi:hypothetical protein